MSKRVIVDTGPLVASLNRNDKHHAWAKIQLSEMKPPLKTCQAVVTEACFLLKRVHGGKEKLLELLKRGVLETDFNLNSEVETVRKLIKKYHNIPMSFADACLVRMSEKSDDAVVFTLDGDFRHYRKANRKIINTIIPHYN